MLHEVKNLHTFIHTLGIFHEDFLAKMKQWGLMSQGKVKNNRSVGLILLRFRLALTYCIISSNLNYLEL